MLISILVALIPHVGGLFGLFGRKDDDHAAVETQGLKTLGRAFRYAGFRVLIIVVVSVVVGLWAADRIHDLAVHWNDREVTAWHLFSVFGLSAIGRAIWSRFV